MKLFNLSLFILSLAIGTSTPVLAADPPQEANPYQSTFEGYKTLSDDNLYDWKSKNVPSNDDGHAGHSIANISTGSKDMSDMEGMDHSQMKHDKPMTPTAGMNHSKMEGMNHENMHPKVDEQIPMEQMNHKKMPGRSPANMAHAHGNSDMAVMDHSKMSDSDTDQIQPNNKEGAQAESQPYKHTSEKGNYADMDMPTKTASKVPTSPWQLIPNFHPIAVHFPIALTIISFLLSIAAYVRLSHPVSTQLAAAGHFTLWLAAIGAVVAVLFGWLAFNSVNHDDAGHLAMLLHRSWAIPTAIGLILIASWDAWKYRVDELIPVPMLFILFLLSQSIAVTGWLGGEVVYRHGIGVLSLPAIEGTGHSHHLNEGAETTSHPHEKNTSQPEVASGHHHDDVEGEPHEH
jgi:uncharacterized membrane protein